jgi:hypothetical protein
MIIWHNDVDRGIILKLEIRDGVDRIYPLEGKVHDCSSVPLSEKGCLSHLVTFISHISEVTAVCTVRNILHIPRTFRTHYNSSTDDRQGVYIFNANLFLMANHPILTFSPPLTPETFQPYF